MLLVPPQVQAHRRLAPWADKAALAWEVLVWVVPVPQLATETLKFNHSNTIMEVADHQLADLVI